MPQEPRREPRISVNKLAEYMTCSPNRRRRILEDAKYPTDFIPTRYNDFYDVAPGYACSRPLDDNILARAIDRLAAREPQSEWERDNIQLNIDLLNHVQDLPDHVEIETYEASTTGDRRQSIVVEGVEISVRPEVLLRREGRNANTLGALKFYLPKSFPLDDEGGAYLAALTHLYLETEFAGESVDFRHCYVFDVPSGRVFTAPRAYTRRRADISAACEEIRDRWERL